MVNEEKPSLFSRSYNSSSEMSNSIDSCRDPKLFSPLRYWKNLLIVSIAFMLTFIANGALANLQSSLNYNAGIGVGSLCAIYVGLILSSFITPLVVWLLKVKWTLVVCCFFYALYSAANFYPAAYTLIPAAGLLGLAASPFWAAVSTYITTSAIQLADVTGRVPETIINRFNGIFFCFLKFGHVIGNTISSVVLTNNSTSVSVDYCGRDSCGSNINFTTIEGGAKTKDNQVSVLISIYVGVGLLAIVVLTFLLDRIPDGNDEDKKFNWSHVRDHLTSAFHLMKSPYLLLLIPIMIYSGVEQAFIGADFTKSYVSCTEGSGMVGYTMIAYGAFDALASVIFGQLEKYTGRIAIFMFGGVLHLVLMVIFVMWNPHTSAMWQMVLLAMGWGVGDAVWQTQIQSIVGVVFPDVQEPAFANYRLWQAVGSAASYALTIPRVICVSHKLYSMMAFLILSLICYISEEYLISKTFTSYKTYEKY
ncbi:protein unc-93 homolog A-like [Diadema antillarum]|uniref:protein unc-93 homolog A-like n=1 Tax=Diadema antillarum TaxID=105358 RepID=UPI003A888AB8